MGYGGILMMVEGGKVGCMVQKWGEKGKNDKFSRETNNISIELQERKHTV